MKEGQLEQAAFELSQALKIIIGDIKSKPNDTRYLTSLKVGANALLKYDELRHSPIKTEGEDEWGKGWDSAITFANNLCVQISDDYNNADMVSQADTSTYCAQQIRKSYGDRSYKPEVIFPSPAPPSSVGIDVDALANDYVKTLKITNRNEIEYAIQDFKAGFSASLPQSSTEEEKGCNCNNVDFGTYENQIEVVPPQHMVEYYTKQGGSKTICLDACVAVEVCKLWKLGITTTGCCCGHNKGEGFIGVIEDDIPRMKEMGYRVAYNQSRPEDEDSFIPKSVKYKI